MTKLRLSPSYRHGHEAVAPRTTLTAESAASVFQTLKNCLAMKRAQECPAAGWEDGHHRSLFYWNGFHHPVRWMPVLRDGWKRLNYSQFLAYYGIPPFDGRARQE